MSFLAELVSQFKSAIQLAGKIEATVDGHTARLTSVENDVREILREMKVHGERIARLEAAEQTLDERAVLYIERALVRARSNDDPDPRLTP